MGKDNQTLTVDGLLADCYGNWVDKDVRIDEVMPHKKVVEKAAIRQVLVSSDNNRSEATRPLGISRRALDDKRTHYRLTN